MLSDILTMTVSDIEAQFSNPREREIALNTKKNQCDRILRDHLSRFFKTNKIDGETFSDCTVSKDLFFDEIYPKKNPTRFINSSKFKGRIDDNDMIDLFIAVTKNNDGEYEKLFWYTLFNVPKDIKPSNLCIKGVIKFKDGENDDLFDRFKECVVNKIDESSHATDSDDDSSNTSKGPKVYQSIVKGKVKKNVEKNIKINDSKSQSDNEFDNVPDSGSISEVNNEEDISSSSKTNELITNENSKDNTKDDSSSSEEDDDEDNKVESINPFKNKTTFQNYLKDNDLRSKKIFKATIENLDEDIKKEFEGIKKTQDFVNKFFSLKIIPKKE